MRKFSVAFALTIPPVSCTIYGFTAEMSRRICEQAPLCWGFFVVSYVQF